jgi:hypothetical protein
VAQQRVDERINKMRSARKHRFNLKTNPLFSRPSRSLTNDVCQSRQDTATTTTIECQTSLRQESIETHDKQMPAATTMTRSRTAHVSYLASSESIKRTIRKSTGNSVYNTCQIDSSSCLKLIFSIASNVQYSRLLLVDQIASIYIQFVVTFDQRLMTSRQFRRFAK